MRLNGFTESWDWASEWTILRQRAWCKSGARDRQRSGAIRRAAARMDHARGGPLYRKVALPSIGGPHDLASSLGRITPVADICRAQRDRSSL